MRSIHFGWPAAGLSLILLASIAAVREARAQGEFPFGMEMTLDAQPQRGSKRVLELWCKGGKGQFSIAGDTVIFVAGQMEDRSCPPDKAQADDDLVAALTEATNWRRQGDAVSFIGTRTLKFRINTN